MRYRAFFSYARADDRIANWLHRQLDGYRAPKPLIGTEGELGPVPAKLHPIFRDRTDLESGGHVDSALQQALQDSETLIVLCTPTSAKSHWVNHEVETFLKLGREAAIFPVIAGGVPDSGDPDTECFPPALRNKGLLAVDLREIKLPSGQLVGDGREGGRLKLIAGLLGVKLDALVQRERRRQRQVVAALSVAALVFLGVAAVAGVQTIAANSNLSLARKNEREAKKQQSIAEANAAKERKARQDERTQRQRADAETLKAIANAREAEKQSGIASENAREARNTLHRFFASRAWEKHKSGDYLAAARYALVGMRVSPTNGELYRAVLGAAMFSAGESAPPLMHDDQVTMAAFSPDGRRIVTASLDRTAKIWDAGNGELVVALSGHESKVLSAAYSPDGRRIVTASSDRTAKVWDASNGALNFALSGHSNFVNSSAFSPDGRRIVTASGDATAKVWDAGNGALIATLTGHGREVTSAAFSPDGARIVTASRDTTAKVWDAGSGALIATLSGLESMIGYAAFSTAAFSPDGRRIVTASRDLTAKVWDAGSGALITVLSGHESRVVSAAFSPDGRSIVTASWDNTAKIWDAGNGTLLFTLSGHGRFVQSAAYSPDGRRIVTASWDKTAKVWDALVGEPIATLTGHEGETSRPAFSPDGRRIATIGADNSAKVSVAGNDALFATSGDVSEFANNVRRAVFTSLDNSTQFFDGASGALTVTLSGPVKGAAYSPVGRRIVTTDGVVTVSVWDSENGAMLATLKGNHGLIERARFSRDGGRIIAPSSTGTDVWDVSRLTQPWQALARDACLNLLGPLQRRFSQADIAGDQLLRAEWPDAKRDVCERVPGVPSVASLRIAAGLPAEPPRSR
jgi:WD40 repeat protein